MFDLDATGAIRPEELMQLGRQAEIGHNRGEWVQEMNAMLSNQRDTAANGLISCAEFVEHCKDLLPEAQEDFDAIVSGFMEVANACRICALQSRLQSRFIEAARELGNSTLMTPEAAYQDVSPMRCDLARARPEAKDEAAKARDAWQKEAAEVWRGSGSRSPDPDQYQDHMSGPL